ncbi:ATP-binding protein [Novispirillum itersonii]|uniref:histidine kinase n=1 Tax=Novispirillum itersonii TaxID=189 RepID=A0A7W9ZG26_NOVIT|nr:ATP-binding protein [Novispirillum itersonii]MBB6210833.1 hypothetical protein [Novispirillum itersonii]
MHPLLASQLAEASSRGPEGSVDLQRLLKLVDATYHALTGGGEDGRAVSAQAGSATDDPLEGPLRAQAAGQIRDLLDAVGEGLLTFSDDLRIMDANASAGLLLGCSAPSLIGRLLPDLLPRTVLQDSTVAEDEFGHVVRLTAGGTETVLLVKRGALPAITGQRHTLLLRDITAPVRAREELDLSRQRFRDYAESSSDWLWEVDDTFTLTQVAGPQTWLRDALMQAGTLRALQPYSANEAFNDFDTLLTAHESFRDLLFRFADPEGGMRVVSLSGKPVFNCTGQFLGYRGTATDISAQERTRERLEATEAKLMAALSGISEGFTLFDHDDRLILCNARYRQMYPDTADVLTYGIRFEEIVQISLERGLYQAPPGRSLSMVVRDRLECHRRADGMPFEMHTLTGKWVRVVEYRTPDGGRIGLHTDISDTVELQAALQAAKEEAEAASRAKSEFLSAMSHELRTPLNAVLGFAQLLAVSRRDPLTAKQREHVDHIRRSGNHLLTLINEVLDLARIESGALTLAPEALTLSSLVQDCLAIVQPLALPGGIRVEVAPSLVRVPKVYADYVRMKQVLLNLLSNAIKYNVPEGQVLISAGQYQSAGLENTLRDDWVRIRISDTGRGIAVEKQGGLFQPFNRLGAEVSGIEGTGIGLKVTRDLMQMMGGQIGFESAEGQGTTFWVDLPVAEAAPVVPSVQKGPGVQGGGEPPHRRLLLIEHRLDVIAGFQTAVAGLPGVSLVSVPSMEDGLFTAHAELPDAIVLGQVLGQPEGAAPDGPEPLTLLRAAGETMRIPVFLLPGVSGEGRQVYPLPHPVTAETLRTALVRGLAGASGPD